MVDAVIVIDDEEYLSTGPQECDEAETEIIDKKGVDNDSDQVHTVE